LLVKLELTELGQSPKTAEAIDIHSSSGSFLPVPAKDAIVISTLTFGRRKFKTISLHMYISLAGSCLAGRNTLIIPILDKNR